MLSAHIRSGSREHSDVFFSREGLVADLHDRLKEENARLYELLNSPEVIAEAVVIWAREQGPIKDVDELKRIMQRHFMPGTTQFYDLAVMLDLNLLELFDRSFRSLSPLRQIIYRLFGRHEALRARFIEEASKATLPPAASRRDAGASPRRETRPVAEPRTARPRGSAPRSRGTGQPGTQRPGATRTSKPPGPRQYTRRDQDKAWDEFRKRIGD